MNPRTASRLAWSLWAGFVVISGAGQFLVALNRSTASFLENLGYLIVFLAMGTVGALIASRRPENLVGWILLAIAGGVALAFSAGEYGRYALITAPGSLPAGIWAEWLASWIWIPILVPLVTFVPLLFPGGGLLSRRWRPVAWLAAIDLVVLGAVTSMLPELETESDVANPAAVQAAGILGDFVYAAGIPLFLGLVVASVASLVIRYRRSGGDERQQIKWFAFAVGLLAIWFLADSVSEFLGITPFGETPVGRLGGIAAFGGIPVAAGIAILRYRLYDIDVVINKTLVFAALAAFITAVYLGIVIGIGALVGSRGNLALSVFATALIAVAFQPVRERARHLANRFVYGKKATPYQVLAEFSQRMGGYSAEEILPQMAKMLAEGTGASTTEVWLRVGNELQLAASWPARADSDFRRLPVGDEPPQIPGADAAFPVSHQGELLGVFTIRMPPAEPLTPVVVKLVSDLASQAALVLRNVRLLAELRASRQRIVATQDEERRRLERDIHDGAQQQLVGLAVKAGLARNLLEKDTQKTSRILDEIKSETHEIVETVRELARGVFPPILAEKGIVSALRSHLAKMGLETKIESDAFGDARFEPQTEAAVYFCIREALQNASKHAEGAPITVSFSFKDGSLEFSVTDQGPGFDPKTVKAGSGLQNMVDRLEALGGTLEVRSAPGRGTSVVGRVPAKITEPVG